LNVVMKAALRTPILERVIGKSVALISFVGRKTGTRYTIPVSYSRDSDSLMVLSRATRTWWRNFEDNPDVELRLSGRTVKGRAAAHPGAEGDLTAVRSFLEKRPMDARAYGATTGGNGAIDEAALRELLGSLAVIRIELDVQ
jgi:hypothetical protein